MGTMAPRSPTIQARLIRLVLACTLPFAIFAGGMTIRFVGEQRDLLRENVLQQVYDLASDVDRYVENIEVSLQVLAASPAVQSEDFAVSYAYAVETQKARGGVGIVLLDRSGQQLINTSWPYGTNLARRSDLETPERVLQSNQAQVSDVIQGASLDRPLVSVQVPVQIGGQPKYVLGMGISPDEITRLLLEQRLPANWRAGLFDRKGDIITRIPNPEGFAGRPSPLRTQFGQAQGVWIESTTSEGLAVYGTFVRSQRTGWTVAIGVPRETFDTPYRNLVALVVGMAVLAVFVSGLLAWFAGRAIARPLDALAREASGLPAGKPIELVNTGIHEIEAILHAMRSAQSELLNRAAERDRAEAELRQTLSQKDVLLREVHHRVKNNLQLIISMANLGKRHGDTPEDLRQRVRAMALVHDQLHQSEDPGKIDFLKYLKQLCSYIAETVDSPRVSIVCDGEPTLLELDVATSVGLMVNEAITNALKHAFPDGRTGIVSTHVRTEGGAVLITVADNGVGLRDTAKAEGFGTRLFAALSKQIGAKFKYTREHDWTRVVLHVPSA
jgi:two-component sensor histidine kinase